MTYWRKKTNGQLGEFLSRQVLKSKGHKVIATNFRAKYGEIDIITYKSKILYFVESKLTTSQSSVIKIWQKKQLPHLKRTIPYFLSQNPKLVDHTYQILLLHFDLSNKGYINLNHYIYEP